MARERIAIRERIAPEITASLFANYRSSAEALMELVDNAIDSRIQGRQLTVDLTINPASLLIVTEGGTGMGVRELERHYLYWGASPKRGRQLLGQYGQGGKAAIGHLGRRFTIEVSRPGDAAAWRITDDDYRDRSRPKTYDVAEVTKRVSEDTGYVRIRIDGVDKRIDGRRLGQRLADSYRPLLVAKEVAMRVGGELIQPEPIHALGIKAVSVNAAGGRLRGWVGLADPERPARGWLPGVRCYKLGRLIAEGEFFGHAGPAQVPGMARLMGEVDIPPVPLTMNKNDFDRDGSSWLEVEERLHRLLAPIVRRLAKEQDEPPPQSALKVAEQVRRLLAQALRLSERVDVFAGLAAARPAERKPKADELPLELEPEPQRQPREPTVPGPARNPPLPRRGFGTIVIRALDPAVRSTTLLEGENRIIVINSRYPLFRERKGDVWYQLETAAREIAKLIESASVAEYEERVNEIVLVAAALRERKRRPLRSGRQLGLL